jgi:hypothetical protein
MLPSIRAVVTLMEKTAAQANARKIPVLMGRSRARLTNFIHPTKTTTGNNRKRLGLGGRLTHEYHGGAVVRLAVSVPSNMMTAMYSAKIPRQIANPRQ